MKPIKEVNLYTNDIKTLKENSNRKFAKYQEPYIKEVYDTDDNLIEIEVVGSNFVRKKAYSNCSSLKQANLPSGLTKIGESAFSYCTNLVLTSLPAGVTRIDSSAFQNCTNLALTNIPAGVTKIGNHTFADCTSLTEITFEGTPTSIDETAFTGCTNLTAINVPWAEGAVANAPWGATNATINYNYTE